MVKNWYCCYQEACNSDAVLNGYSLLNYYSLDFLIVFCFHQTNPYRHLAPVGTRGAVPAEGKHTPISDTVTAAELGKRQPANPHTGKTIPLQSNHQQLSDLNKTRKVAWKHLMLHCLAIRFIQQCV